MARQGRRRHWMYALLLVVILSALVLFAFRAANTYHASSLRPYNDGHFCTAQMMEIIMVSQASGIVEGLKLAILPELKYEFVISSLYIGAAIASPALPVSPSSAVFLNGFWWILFGILFYKLFSKMTNQPYASFLMALLISIPHSTDEAIRGYQYLGLNAHMFGLSDFDVNTFSFFLIGISLALLLLSDCFMNWRYSSGFGVAVALLALGRVHALGILAAMLTPYMIIVFAQRSQQDRRLMLRSAGLSLVVVMLLSGWWLLPRLPVFFERAFHLEYENSTIRTESLEFITTIWYWFLKNSIYVVYTPFIPILFGWRLSDMIGNDIKLKSFLRNTNWAYAWFWISPILVMFAFRASFWPYAKPSLTGAFLFFMFPCSREGVSIPAGEHARLPLRRPFLVALTLVAASSMLIFSARLHSFHRSPQIQSARVVADIFDRIQETSRPIHDRKIRVLSFGSAEYNCTNYSILSMYRYGVPAQTWLTQSTWAESNARLHFLHSSQSDEIEVLFAQNPDYAILPLPEGGSASSTGTSHPMLQWILDHPEYTQLEGEWNIRMNGTIRLYRFLREPGTMPPEPCTGTQNNAFLKAFSQSGAGKILPSNSLLLH